MAFEVPIEADRPGDAGFLSSFVRAPIVGLMWIFGVREDEQLAAPTPGLLAIEENSDDSDQTTVEENADEILCSFSAWEFRKNQVDKFMSSDEGRPGTVSSDTSEDGDVEERVLPEEHSEKESGETATLRSSRKRQNSISWSDESGRSLVFYCDEVSSRKLSCLLPLVRRFLLPERAS